MGKAQQILKEVFGYNYFRPYQQEIITNILNKKDTLVIMPTGGGKSLCYQIPALIFSNLTIVISPLISLMKDQVMQLNQMGIKASLLNSSISVEEYNENYLDIKNKKAKLLYVAPESLGTDRIINLLNEVETDCLAVDEAHCISEWGHDFRKDYRQIGNLRKRFPAAVCVAFTATATLRVQNDILKNLRMNNPGKFVASFNRENLFLQVLHRRAGFRQTIDFIKKYKGESGIIYCFSRKQVDSLAAKLSEMNFSVRPYHAGLSDQERNENQELFINEKVDIIVATIAFGMGINKSNVRFILHYNLPQNIESYYQQIGRAGRDGSKANCLLLFSYSDIGKINYFINQKEDPEEKKSAKNHLEAMINFAEYHKCRRIPLITYFGEKYNIEECNMCDNCLGTESEKIDITVPAQKFLSAVKRTNEIYGGRYIIDILTGKDGLRIRNNNHYKLSVFRIGTEYTLKQWNHFMRQFINQNLLKRNPEYGSLTLTEKANDVLFNGIKVKGQLIESESISLKEPEELSYNKELFEILRKERKKIAEETNVPPFVIFSDRSLIDMASLFPTDQLNFLQVFGVGRKKLEKYGNKFLHLINDYVKNNAKILNIKRYQTRIINEKRRYELVGDSFNTGKTIKEFNDRV